MSRVSVVIVVALVLLLLPLIILVTAVVAIAEIRWKNELERCIATKSSFEECANCKNAQACDEIAREEEVARLVKAGEQVPSYMFS